MEEELKYNKKSNSKLLIIVMVLAIIFAGAGGFLLGQTFSTKDENKTEKTNKEEKTSDEHEKTTDIEKKDETEPLEEEKILTEEEIYPEGKAYVIEKENSEVSKELQEQLIKIALIDDKIYVIPTGNINSLKDEQKSEIIYHYALNNSLLTSVKGEEYEKCAAGSGECPAISEENYKKIKSLYNFGEFNDTLIFDKYKDYNLYIYGGDIYEYNVKHNITFDTKNGMVILDRQEFYKDGKLINTTGNFAYVFKKNENNEYYLSHISY